MAFVLAPSGGTTDPVVRTCVPICVRPLVYMDVRRIRTLLRGRRGELTSSGASTSTGSLAFVVIAGDFRHSTGHVRSD